MLGRSVRTNIPNGNSEMSEEEFRERDWKLKNQQKQYSDRRRRAKVSSELVPGDIVWVKKSDRDKGKRGCIVNSRKELYLYDVRVEGKTLRRNRKHLRKMSHEGVIVDFESETEEDEPVRDQDSSSEEVSSSESESSNESKGEGVSEMREEEKKEPKTDRPKRTISKRHLSRDFAWY